jgi:hypothetical protein
MAKKILFKVAVRITSIDEVIVYASNEAQAKKLAKAGAEDEFGDEGNTIELGAITPLKHPRDTTWSGDAVPYSSDADDTEIAALFYGIKSPRGDASNSIDAWDKWNDECRMAQRKWDGEQEDDLKTDTPPHPHPEDMV